MATPTIYHAATLLLDGRVLVAGGDVYAVNRNTTGPPVSSAQLYDPESGTWTATSNMSVAHETHVAELLPDGTVFVAGGYSVKGGEILASAERYEPVSGRWFPATNMNVQRAFAAAALLADGRVLVTAASTAFKAKATSWLPPSCTTRAVPGDRSEPRGRCRRSERRVQGVEHITPLPQSLVRGHREGTSSLPAGMRD